MYLLIALCTYFQLEPWWQCLNPSGSWLWRGAVDSPASARIGNVDVSLVLDQFDERLLKIDGESLPHVLLQPRPIDGVDRLIEGLLRRHDAPKLQKALALPEVKLLQILKIHCHKTLNSSLATLTVWNERMTSDILL